MYCKPAEGLGLLTFFILRGQIALDIHVIDIIQGWIFQQQQHMYCLLTT